MELSAKVTGMDAAIAEVKKQALSTKQRVSKTVRAGLELIKEKSAEYVPLDKGPLRRSRRVEKKRGQTHGEVVYGNDQVPYALAQHEVPPPPEKSELGSSYTHTPPRSWKYLERAGDELEAEVRQMVSDAVAGNEPPSIKED